MAEGTGLPFPKTGVLEEPPKVIDGDKLSASRAWGEIAADGAQLANAAFDTLRAHEHLQKAGAVAKFENTHDDFYRELSQQFPGDPQGLENAALAHNEGALSEAPPWMAPHASKFLQGKMDAALRTVTNQKRAADDFVATDAIKARLERADSDVVANYQAGRGPVEGQVAIATYNGVLDTLVAQQRVAPERADLMREDLLTRANGAAIRNQLETVYASQGYEAARNHLMSAVRDLGVNFKVGDKITRDGLAWLRTQESGLRGERDALRKEWSAARGQVDTLAPDVLLDMARRADILGLPSVASDVRGHVAGVQIWRELRALPSTVKAHIGESGAAPGDAAPALAAAAKPMAPEVRAAIDEASKATGVPADYLVNLAGRESSFDPNAKAATSSAGGLFQFVDATWRDMLRKYGAKYGLALNAAKTDARANALMAAELTKENGAALKDAGLAVNPATLRLAHFAGAEGAAKLLKADPNEPAAYLLPDAADANRKIFFTGDAGLRTVADVVGIVTKGLSPAAVDLSTTPSGLVALKLLKKEMGKDFAKRLADWESADRKLELPSLDEIAVLGAEAHAIGTPEQQQRVAELAAQAEYGVKFQKMSAADRATAISAWNDKLKAGGSKFERELRNKLTDADSRISNAYRDDPYGAAYRYASGVEALPPLDFASEGVGELLQRKLAQQNQIRADQGLPAFSILRPTEAADVALKLITGPANDAAKIVATLSALPNDAFKATLEDKAMRDALGGMVRSYDPTRLNAGMAALDRYWRVDPVGFKSTFGKETLDRLQTWQSWANTATPADIAERFKRADDPAAAGARQALRAAAETELKNINPADVVAAFATSIIPFTGPGEPINLAAVRGVEGAALERLKWEYGLVYADLRESGVPADKAKEKAIERLRTEWGSSVTANGALMRLPPEKYYPQAGGSHDWLRDDLAALVQKLRPDQTSTAEKLTREAIARAPLGGVVLPIARPVPTYVARALVADKQTEAEIAAGKPPSYVVVVTNTRTGQDEVLSDPATGRTRFAFDPSARLKADEDAFSARRAYRATESLADFFDESPSP